MSVLEAEAENIRRLQREVYCIEGTLRAMGKTNRCSKEWITLNTRLDAAKDELHAALEDQEHLRSISSEGSPGILSSSSYSDDHLLQLVRANTPNTPSTLMILSHELQHMKDQLEQTPKYSLLWFELKQKMKEYEMVVGETQTKPKQKRCELQKVDEGSISVLERHLQKTQEKPIVYPKGREPPAVGKVKNDSIFRPVTAKAGASNTESVSRPLSNVQTSATYDSSSSYTSTHSDKLNVKVKVISVDGLVARRYEPKLPTQRKKNAASINDRVTVVASFSQLLSGTEFLTHLPSNPIEVETSITPFEAFPQEIVEWPSDEDDRILDDNSIALSTYQCYREFQQENQRDGKSSAKRFIPQMCPINISIARRGKMLPLGKANLVITGEEQGAFSSVVPIFFDYQHSQVKNMKKLLKRKKSTHMVRFQEDDVKFGLKDGAMLRVLVSVEAECTSTQQAQAQETKDTKQPSSTTASSVESPQCRNDNKKPTEDNLQLAHKIERMKLRIKPASNNEVTPPRMSKLSRAHETAKHSPQYHKDSKHRDDEYSNTDDSLATSVLNDVHLRTATALVGNTDANAISMQDDQPTKPFHRSNPHVNNLLLEVCSSLNFDIAEMWLHEDNDYHLINSHVQRSNLEPSVYDELREVYQEGSSDQTHLLSLSLCKWSKKTGNVLWITEQETPRLAQALKYSISEVQAAVAVPIYDKGVYATMIYFSLKGSTSFVPGAKEDYLVEMSENLVRMSK